MFVTVRRWGRAVMMDNAKRGSDRTGGKACLRIGHPTGGHHGAQDQRDKCQMPNSLEKPLHADFLRPDIVAVKQTLCRRIGANARFAAALDGDAAIDDEILSRGVFGIVARQPQDDGGDVLRRADPSHRLAGGEGLARRVIVASVAQPLLQ